MRKPKFISGVYSIAYTFIGIMFIPFVVLIYIGMLKPSPHSFIQDTDTMAILFLAISLVSIFTGIIFGIVYKYHLKNYNKLLNEKVVSTGKVSKVSKLWYCKLGGSYPYVVEYTYNYNGNQLKGRSQLLWHKPNISIDDNVNIFIDTQGKSACDL